MIQVIIKRGEKVDGPPGPIVVATRNDDLQAVVDATPEDRRQGVRLHPPSAAICASANNFTL